MNRPCVTPSIPLLSLVSAPLLNLWTLSLPHPAGPLRFLHDAPAFRFSSITIPLVPFDVYTPTIGTFCFPHDPRLFPSLLPRCCSLSPSHPRLEPPSFSSRRPTAYYIHARFSPPRDERGWRSRFLAFVPLSLSLSYPICFFWRNMHERAFENVSSECRKESMIALLGLLIRSPFRIFGQVESRRVREVLSAHEADLEQPSDDHPVRLRATGTAVASSDRPSLICKRGFPGFRPAFRAEEMTSAAAPEEPPKKKRYDFIAA